MGRRHGSTVAGSGALLLALLVSFSRGVAQMGPSGAGAADAAGTITARDLEVRIGVLAHDSMRGRDTPSPELEKTARYVAEKFRAFGLRPGAGESYLQEYPLTVVSPGPADGQWLRLRGPEGELALDPVRDFIAVPVAEKAEGGGPLVAVPPGEAAEVPGQLVLIRAEPPQLQRAFRGIRELFDEGGAAGVLVVASGPEEFLQGLRTFFQARRVSLGEPEALPGPVAVVSEGALPPSLAEALRTGGALPPGWSGELHTEGRVETAVAYNTIGWLQGSDPVLRHEYVLFTAHMDHVGVGRPVDGDSIYNGADDNASGTGTIVELAQAFAMTEPGPRRSLVFMTVSGEEKGLWGSRWYAEHPTFPLGRTVADINVDMIGRNWKDTVVAIGKAESTLGETVGRVAAAHPELGLTVIGDPWPEERFYFRSDHYNFARNGVPILFFFSGVHGDYHRPSDEPERIDYEKTARIGRLIYYLGLEVANAPERPRWDEEAYRRIVEEGRP